MSPPKLLPPLVAAAAASSSRRRRSCFLRPLLPKLLPPCVAAAAALVHLLCLVFPFKEMELGRSCSRVEVWNTAHKKKDGSFVNDEAEKQSEELNMITQSCSETKVFTRVFGKEHPGRVQSMGHCVSPSQYIESTSGEGSSSESSAEVKKLNAEMTLIKAQMAFLLEHFGSQLPRGFPTNNQ